MVLTGTHFLPGATVYFDGVPATSVHWHSVTTLSALTPAATTTWTQKPLPSPILTSAAPSAVVTDRSVYVVYKGAESDSTIYVARSLDATGSWAKTNFPAAVSTSTRPTAFLFEGRLYVFYKGFVDERVYVAQLPDNAIWTPLSP